MATRIIRDCKTGEVTTEEFTFTPEIISKDARKDQITAEANDIIDTVVDYPRGSQSIMADILDSILVAVDPLSSPTDKANAINFVKQYRPAWSWRNAVRAEESRVHGVIDNLPEGTDPQSEIPNWPVL